MPKRLCPLHLYLSAGACLCQRLNVSVTVWGALFAYPDTTPMMTALVVDFLIIVSSIITRRALFLYLWSRESLWAYVRMSVSVKESAFEVVAASVFLDSVRQRSVPGHSLQALLTCSCNWRCCLEFGWFMVTTILQSLIMASFALVYTLKYWQLYLDVPEMSAIPGFPIVNCY